MKKVGVFLFLLLLFYGQYEYVDVSKFERDTKKVEVKGAVEKPGIYEVEKHATSGEILQLAGGVSEQGDVSQINHTLDLPNNSVLVVKEKTEKRLISINAASLEELDTLPGVGPAVAQRILEYRSAHPFRSTEELKEVKGIGDKMFAKLLDQIML